MNIFKEKKQKNVMKTLYVGEDMNQKISKLAKDNKVKESVVIRKLIDFGFGVYENLENE